MFEALQRFPGAGGPSARARCGWRAWALSAALLGGLAGQAGAAPVMSVAAPSSATVGTTVVVTVQIEDAVELGAWQFDLAYDPALLQLAAVLEGPFLASTGTTFFSPGLDLPGIVSLVTDSWVDVAAPPSGSGTLAQFTFTTLATGVAPLNLAGVFLNLLDSGFAVTGDQICIGTEEACATTSVAEPGSLALSLLGVWLLGRRFAGSSKSPVLNPGEAP